MAKAAPVKPKAPKKATKVAAKIAPKTAPKRGVKPAPVAAKTPATKAALPARYVAPKALPTHQEAEPLRPAGGWLRLLARFLDGIVLGLVGILFGLLMTFFGALVGLIEVSEASPSVTSYEALTWILGILLGLAYQGYFLSRYKATPGRMFLKLEVQHAETHQALSFWRAVGRSVADWLNLLTLNLAYLMVFWRRDKRGLHDLIIGSRVVRRSELLPTWRLVTVIMALVMWLIALMALVAIIVVVMLIHVQGAENFKFIEKLERLDVPPQPQAVPLPPEVIQ